MLCARINEATVLVHLIGWWQQSVAVNAFVAFVFVYVGIGCLPECVRTSTQQYFMLHTDRVSSITFLSFYLTNGQDIELRQHKYYEQRREFKTKP